MKYFTINSDLSPSINMAITTALLPKKEKEFRCHVQFVNKIGLNLSKRYNADPLVVEIACLLHDIGRDEEKAGEEHEEASVRISREIIKDFEISQNQKDLILNCIGNHNLKNPLNTIEEKIVVTADSASKVLYHEAFMLMCKKESYDKKLEWGLKYLNKGFNKIQIDEYKDEVRPKYEELLEIYNRVLV